MVILSGFLAPVIAVLRVLAFSAWAAEPTIVKDCETCPELVVIEGSSFTMGAEKAEGEKWDALERMGTVRHCQTNWPGAEEAIIKDSQAAS